MRIHVKKTRLLIGTAIAALGLSTALTSAVLAGGFAIREQSTEFQGMSFAGNAAGGGGLSGMFWNPAVVGQFNGIRSESHYAFIAPDSEITALPGSTLLPAGVPASSGNIGKDALVGASYLSYQLSNQLVFGFSFNAPFGLSTEPGNSHWAGQTHARTSKIVSYNGQAVLAYRFSPSLVVGAGLMMQRMEGTLKSAAGVGPASPNAVIKGDDVAFGFTLGALWQPAERTSIGIGYRSSIDQTLEGNMFLAAPGFGAGGIGSASIKAGLTTPETVTVSARHGLHPGWTALGTVEWTNWSRLEKLDVVCTSNSLGANVLGCPVAGGVGTLATSLPLGWGDGWMFALGLENQYNDKLTWRTGLAYEISPIQGADERTPRAPDADRIWASIGATYKWSDNISLDLAYSHIFVEDAKIDRTQNGIRLLADVDTSIDILSASVKMKLGDVAPPLEPMK